MPFERCRAREGAQLRRLIDRLKECGAESAVIYPCRDQRQPCLAVSIDHAVEPELAGRRKPLWMLDGQHSLRSAVTLLLTVVRGNRWTAMVPHHGCRSKSDLIALLQKAPANIYIIASLAKLL